MEVPATHVAQDKIIAVDPVTSKKPKLCQIQENIMEMMEEMAGMSKEPMGTRTPGEKCKYETWNEAIEAAALVVEPNPHVEEERQCKDVAIAVRRLKKIF